MKSEQQNQDISRLTGICEELSARLTELDQRVAHLTERVSELESGDPDGIVVEIDEEESKMPFGRPQLKHRAALGHQRDRVLGFLQLHMKEVAKMIEDATSADSLRAALLKRYGKQRPRDAGVAILLEYPEELWSFITKSGRYHGDAVELASAMAGPPEMKPRAALDYFLSKENAGNLKAQQVGAMKERTDRIYPSIGDCPRLVDTITDNGNYSGALELGTTYADYAAISITPPNASFFSNSICRFSIQHRYRDGCWTNK